jgi:hypothetical protein
MRRVPGQVERKRGNRRPTPTRTKLTSELAAGRRSLWPVQRLMSVQIGNLTFDRVRYNRGGDVLYLHRADPEDAVDFDASHEGQALRFDAQAS